LVTSNTVNQRRQSGWKVGWSCHWSCGAGGGRSWGRSGRGRSWGRGAGCYRRRAGQGRCDWCARLRVDSCRYSCSSGRVNGGRETSGGISEDNTASAGVDDGLASGAEDRFTWWRRVDRSGCSGSLIASLANCLERSQVNNNAQCSMICSC
jgi:hypothetical protein